MTAKTTKIIRRDFVDWLEKQNPERVFRMANCTECALGEYLREVNSLEYFSVWHDTIDNLSGKRKSTRKCKSWEYNFQMAFQYGEHQAEDLLEYFKNKPKIRH